MRPEDVIAMFKLECDKDPRIWDLPSVDICTVPDCLGKRLAPFITCPSHYLVYILYIELRKCLYVLQFVPFPSLLDM